MPEVLAVRIGIYAGLKKWELMEVVAKRLSEFDPANVQWHVSWAYAARRAESLEAAKAVLNKAVKIHEKEPILYYNLACYHCQLQDMEYRLRAGDIIYFNKRICPVIRVNDCAAVIAVPQPCREFTTRFGKEVFIHPQPRLVRIGSNSETKILRRAKKGGILS